MVVSKPTSLITESTSFCLLIPNRTPKTQQHKHLSCVSNPSSFTSHFAYRFNNSSFLSSPQQSQRSHFGFPSLLECKRGTTLCVHALKKQGKSGTGLMETSDFDEDEFDELDDDDDENFDVVDDDGGDDDDNGMFLPFGKMKKWLENKPRGFGEGKVYNTSIEDKLLDEMEQSRRAQAANISSLKTNPVKPTSKKEKQNKKAMEVVPHGIHVRLVNLPKKKNIHRDLKSAFKDVPGIVNIIPAVSGNKKTKDPICKGFAFVDFNSEEDAARFVQLFSRRSVVFGKIQKQIKCQLVNSNSYDDESAGTLCYNQLLMVPNLEGDLNADYKMDDSSFEETASAISDDPDNELITATLEDLTKNVKSFSMSELNGYDSTEPRIEPATSPFSSKKQDKRQASKKKIIVEGGEKVPRLDIPGSAKRLKIKEKAVLTNVFTKYASKAALASGDES